MLPFRKKRKTRCKPQDDERQKKASRAIELLGSEVAKEILEAELNRLKRKPVGQTDVS